MAQGLAGNRQAILDSCEPQDNPYLATSGPLRRIADLLFDRGDYDEKFQGPTEEAFNAAWKAVSKAYAVVVGLPPLYAAPLGDGSLYLRWRVMDREVSVTVPREGSTQLVWRSSPNPAPAVPVGRLVEYLLWLTED